MSRCSVGGRQKMMLQDLPFVVSWNAAAPLLWCLPLRSITLGIVEGRNGLFSQSSLTTKSSCSGQSICVHAH